MEKHVRTILHSALVLFILGYFVEVSAQPVVVDETPNNSTNFNAIGDFTYFSSGDVVVAEKISCGGDCSTYLMKINKQLIPGLYLINLRTNGTRFSKRLLVK